jgi:hypothetical protein
MAVIRKRAKRAPQMTATLLYLIAIIAAMKKVLSPSSETTIEEKDWTNEEKLSFVFDGLEPCLEGSTGDSTSGFARTVKARIIRHKEKRKRFI